MDHSGENHLFDVKSPNNRVDLFMKSESPRVQEILLHQRLHEEIEKNPNGKVRYVNSELYTRNLRQRLPKSVDSEIQSETLNIGLLSSTLKGSEQEQSSRIPSNQVKQKNKTNHTRGEHQITSGNALIGAGFNSTAGDEAMSCADGGHQDKRGLNLSATSANRIDHCPVCRIKEVTGDLMNLNKMIQKSNEHFGELKAKFIRPHNAHHMME